jgi:hypothetical protein
MKCITKRFLTIALIGMLTVCSVNIFIVSQITQIIHNGGGLYLKNNPQGAPEETCADS